MIKKASSVVEGDTEIRIVKKGGRTGSVPAKRGEPPDRG